MPSIMLISRPPVQFNAVRSFGRRLDPVTDQIIDLLARSEQPLGRATILAQFSSQSTSVFDERFALNSISRNCLALKSGKRRINLMPNFFYQIPPLFADIILLLFIETVSLIGLFITRRFLLPRLHFSEA